MKKPCLDIFKASKDAKYCPKIVKANESRNKERMEAHAHMKEHGG